MAESAVEQEKLAIVRLARLRAMAVGISLGLIFALSIFVATNWLVIKGGERIGPHLALLGEYFIGYKVTFLGSFIGAAYGAVVGFVLGYIVARLYNTFADQRSADKSM